jgi:hypothetical protein
MENLTMSTERKDDKPQPQQSENVFDRIRREAGEKQEREAEDRRRFDELLERQRKTYR